MDRSTVHSKESLWFELQKVGEHGVKGLRKYFESIGRWACVTAAEGGHPKYWSQRLNKNSRTRFIWRSHWNHASCTEISSIFRIQYLTQKKDQGTNLLFCPGKDKVMDVVFLGAAVKSRVIKLFLGKKIAQVHLGLSHFRSVSAVVGPCCCFFLSTYFRIVGLAIGKVAEGWEWRQRRRERSSKHLLYKSDVCLLAALKSFVPH